MSESHGRATRFVRVVVSFLGGVINLPRGCIGLRSLGVSRGNGRQPDVRKLGLLARVICLKSVLEDGKGEESLALAW